MCYIHIVLHIFLNIQIFVSYFVPINFQGYICGFPGNVDDMDFGPVVSSEPMLQLVCVLLTFLVGWEIDFYICIFKSKTFPF